jgi:hypothetical protein
MYKSSGNTYKTPQDDTVQFAFSELKNDKTQLLSVYQSGRITEAKRHVTADLSSINLDQYTGRFYSPELESTIDIILKEDDLIGHHGRHGDLPLKLINKNELYIAGFGSIAIVRNPENLIKGIRVSNGRARNVWFLKQK